MTRINVVPVETLCDQHLLAEHRELTRIPNTIHSGKAVVDVLKIPSEYTLGTGHVRFFYDKLGFLYKRYMQLHNECLYRGFNVQFIWPEDVKLDDPRYKFLFKNYTPTLKAHKINMGRIIERTPVNARYTKRNCND